MASEVNIGIRLVEGMHFVGANEAGLSVDLDSPAEGLGVGPSPMQMVLISLASCSGMDVITIMRKKRQRVTAFEVRAHGTRSEEYPRPYTAIRLEFHFTGEDIDPVACERAIELSRDRYCPVWAMLAHSVVISYAYTIADT
jgi:putative redox protein